MTWPHTSSHYRIQPGRSWRRSALQRWMRVVAFLGTLMPCSLPVLSRLQLPEASPLGRSDGRRPDASDCGTRVPAVLLQAATFVADEFSLGCHPSVAARDAWPGPVGVTVPVTGLRRL